MINGSPINGGPINGIAAQSIAPPAPITAGYAFVWALRLTVDGVDMTASLTGSVTVDREEGAAGTASFTLHLATGTVVPDSWRGKVVTIDYLSTAAGVTTEVRRYTGRISDPTYSLTLRLLECQCSDQLQQRVEALSVASVDSLIGGYWSDDVFEPVEGRSRWDYAQERLASLPYSLECSAYGDLRTTTWFAKEPAFVFGAGTTIYDSMSVDLADLSSLINKVEIDAEYRFQRLRQRNEQYSWIIPGAVTGGFCNWRIDSTELPDVDMIVSAVEGVGYTMLDASYGRLPGDSVDPCGNGIAWNNEYHDLLLSAGWKGAMRWAQSVTEQYAFTLVAEASVTASGEQISRDRVSVEVESEKGETWETEEFTDGVSGHEDVRDEERRQAALKCMLHQAQTQIYEAHRTTTVSWTAPTSMVMDIDLVHTLKVDDQSVLAQGKCVRIADTFDLDAGLATTALSIAVMRGGGDVTDPLILPPYSTEPQPDPDGASPYPGGLPNQIGGKGGVPPYDEERYGFSGNYSVSDIADPVKYPRRFKSPSPEIGEELRDELEVPIAATYRVAIPNDLLELN
ncbi:hypothetical protein AX279_19760 [Pseudomonas sp. J237]|nr:MULTISPECIES: hypothetical protein [Pseudomonas]OEO24069.1 hypothetical protein AX279_19760 [Pseudomonas sp. J237]